MAPLPEEVKLKSLSKVSQKAMATQQSASSKNGTPNRHHQLQQPEDPAVKIKSKLHKLRSGNTKKIVEFKLVKNDKLKQYFDKFAGSDRLTKQRLIDMMALRYPMGFVDEESKTYQTSIGDTMVKQLWIHLEIPGSDLKYDQYCEKVEKWFNQDDSGLKKFIFECFDTMHTGRITERSMFKLMEETTRRDPQKKRKQNELLRLDQYESDMF